MSGAMPAILKITLGDEIHRVPCATAEEFGFEFVQRTVESLWPGSVATYLDEDRDRCTLLRATFSDFLQTAREADDGRDVFRLQLSAGPNSSPSPPSAKAPSAPKPSALPACAAVAVPGATPRQVPVISRGRRRLSDHRSQGTWEEDPRDIATLVLEIGEDDPALTSASSREAHAPGKTKGGGKRKRRPEKKNKKKPAPGEADQQTRIEPEETSLEDPSSLVLEKAVEDESECQLDRIDPEEPLQEDPPSLVVVIEKEVEVEAKRRLNIAEAEESSHEHSPPLYMEKKVQVEVDRRPQAEPAGVLEEQDLTTTAADVTNAVAGATEMQDVPMSLAEEKDAPPDVPEILCEGSGKAKKDDGDGRMLEVEDEGGVAEAKAEIISCTAEEEGEEEEDAYVAGRSGLPLAQAWEAAALASTTLARSADAGSRSPSPWRVDSTAVPQMWPSTPENTPPPSPRYAPAAEASTVVWVPIHVWVPMLQPVN
eukprot:TRINITY_DN7247_c0_g1_i1.p1 TRINITY_DN7247_c0_g1~~TRINITY_DN7247_c0_g1_i1.p1  ORF type:complete len:483 (+),score=98.52 TRINITY_DN7247_c0_g1_i1:63-1511(+)